MTGKRRPPRWEPHRDPVAKLVGLTPITYKHPISATAQCHYCLGKANTRDHIVPDSVGGSAQWWNLVPACSACNESKADRQSCSCHFCLRAIALWGLGFRRNGKSWREKKEQKKNNRAARGVVVKPPVPPREGLTAGLTDDQISALNQLKASL